MKILMYGNEWSDFETFLEVKERLEEQGAEVACATHNFSLLPVLSIRKQLIVTFKSYFEDVAVVMDGREKLPGKKCLYFSELMEVLA